jgi:sugar phosphate isomerase/epimerase
VVELEGKIMMKIGCISWSYRNEFAANKYDIPNWIRHSSRDVRLDGVELWNNHFESLKEEYLDTISATCRDEKIELYSVATKCLFGNFSKGDIKRAKTTFRKWLAAANILGTSIMRVSIGGEELRSPAHRQIVFESLSEVIDEGEYPGISVGIENQEPGIVQHSGDVFEMNRRSAGRLKLILDNGSIIDKSTVYAFMEEALPYAILIHTKFSEFDPRQGDAVLDYNRIIELLRAGKYAGYLSVEYDGEGQASELVPRFVTFLRGKLG